MLFSTLNLWYKAVYKPAVAEELGGVTPLPENVTDITERLESAFIKPWKDIEPTEVPDVDDVVSLLKDNIAASLFLCRWLCYTCSLSFINFPFKEAPYSYFSLPNNSAKQTYSCKTRVFFNFVAILATRGMFRTIFWQCHCYHGNMTKA